jgi:hypothetical protein
MKFAHSISFLTLAAGAMISALAMACGGGDEAPTPTPADADTATASASPSDTPSATSTRTNTATPTNTSTPTATPTPFDGTVARLSIPKFGIDYPIEPLGHIAGANQLDTPHDETGAIGWYHIYPKPGFGQNSVYSAHVNYNGAAGPFDRLNEARIGDRSSCRWRAARSTSSSCSTLNAL